MRRRSVLSLLGLGGVGALTAKGLSGCRLQLGKSSALQSFPFQPVRVPLPVNSDGLQASEQQSTYQELVLEDRLTVPEGFRSQLLAAWGDPLGDSRFGFNNDHLGFVQHAPDRASMTVNFEYISAVPWVQGFAEVVGRPLPFAALVASLQASEQQSTYRELALEDRLTVPDGFESQLLAAWGDSLGNSRFGFNNDHLGFVQQGPDRASMTVNFEYISAVPWVQGFAEVVGRPLPFAALVASLQPSDGVVDCTALPAGDRRLQQIRAVADEAMTDLGSG